MSKGQIKLSAPGKIHFLGEHVVVYGKPALITTVDKRCFVTLTPNKSSIIQLVSENLQRSGNYSVNDIQKKRDEAQLTWEQFADKGDLRILKSITLNEMDFPLIAIGETLRYFKMDLQSGFSLSIQSDIPIGAGLGSSAAIAVAVVGAITTFLGKDIQEYKQDINDIAFLAEQKIHGMPSGGDNSTVCFGGLVWYRKETPDLKIIQPISFSIPVTLAKNFMIIDTGRTKESTGEMVTLVKNLYEQRPTMVEEVFSDQEKLTRELVTVLKDNNEAELLSLIRAGEKNLEKLGVTSPLVEKLIRDIEKSGGAAKVCGGGGKTDATGAVLVYHRKRAAIRKITKEYNLECYTTLLGVEGLRYE